MKYLWKQELVEQDDVHIDLHDRGYQFGDGLYEVIRVYCGYPFMLDEHVIRMFDGANKTDLIFPVTKNELKQLVYDLIAANQLYMGYVYLQLTRGDGIVRNHLFPQCEESTPVLSGFTKVLERDVHKMETGVKVITIPDERWLKCDIKTISLMGNVLARHQATKAGVQDVIQHRDGIVTECSTSNLFIVKDGVIWTHPNNNLILPGITKLVVMQCAAELGVLVMEEPFTLDALMSADEVFLTSTTQEVTAIVEIDGKMVANGLRGPITEQLQTVFISKAEAVCGLIR